MSAWKVVVVGGGMCIDMYSPIPENIMGSGHAISFDSREYYNVGSCSFLYYYYVNRRGWEGKLVW